MEGPGKFKFDVVCMLPDVEVLPTLQEILSGTTPFQCLGMGNGKSFHEKVHTVEMLGLITGRSYGIGLESPLITLIFLGVWKFLEGQLEG